MCYNIIHPFFKHCTAGLCFSTRCERQPKNTALGQPEEELHLLTALPNRFGFPVVSLSFTIPGFWGDAEPFPCCDTASDRVRWCPQTLLWSQHLLRSSHCCPALLHPQWLWVHSNPWAVMNPRELAREKGHRGAQGSLCVLVQQSLGMPWVTPFIDWVWGRS